MARMTKPSELEDMSGGFEFTQAGIRNALDSNSDKVPVIAQELSTNAPAVLTLMFGGNMPAVINQVGGPAVVQGFFNNFAAPPTTPGLTQLFGQLSGFQFPTLQAQPQGQPLQVPWNGAIPSPFPPSVPVLAGFATMWRP